MTFQRIAVDPEICGGKPCIRGLRFPVSRLLGLLAAGETPESIRRYPPSTSNLWELAGNNPFPALLLLTAIITWVALGGYLVYSWLWNVAGYELVEVSDQTLCIRRMALGFTCTRQYLTEHVKDIRVAPSPGSS
jgi:hypothetical protein